jgi:UDP-N-acetyl-2-amino-2-deoxyglucuronate dehydrogenase
MGMRAVVIGCGRIMPMHLASLQMIGEAYVCAVCDIKEERAAKTAEKYGCRYYVDYKEMIINERPNVVHICTPHHLHYPMTIFSAEHGAHVITEKPMAIKFDDAKDMVKVCRENQVTLSVMFQNRYNRAVRFIKKEIESGNLGKPLSGRVIVTWNRSDEYYLNSDWKGTWDKEGGGVVIDQAIHSLDLVRYIIDKKSVKVQANISNRKHKKIQVEDTAEGYIEFQDDFMLSFYTMNYFTYDAPIEIMIHCEEGTAQIIGDEGHIDYNNGTHTYINLLEEDKIDYGEGTKKYWGYCHYTEIERIYDSIRNNRDVELSGEDCLETQKIINAIYESGKTGEIVVV